MSTKRSTCEDYDVSSRNAKKTRSRSSTKLAIDPLGFSQPKCDRSDYNVGWICAVMTEYVAAQTFLDATHDVPDTIPQNDNNNYTLGEMGQHNVVIAVLPMGEYGTNSAASVAGDMLRTFPNIRIGLMVGIAGGAPTDMHDIRLGDVIVSVPRDGKGGVLQYDFGKAVQGKEFQVTGHLNQPPRILLNAVSGLCAKYELEGHQLEDSVNKALEQKRASLKQKYKRPDPDTDKLYLTNVIHPAGNQERCAKVCGDDLSKLVRRESRTQDDDNPTIHYGTIASANQLMKDASLRDKFSKENNILGFEMEAAGFMNSFPCLVVRGICDYSDTHKSKEWQGYAAMVAAAYTKDLLSCIPANGVEAETRIRDIISSVDLNVNELRYDVKDLALEQKHAELYRWLSPPAPSTNYNKALQQRQEHTGIWLLQSDPFASWKSHQGSFLWLYGIPGCGKTILSSTVIEYLESISTKNLLYFYFDFSNVEKQTLQSVVSSLVYQLYHKCKSAQKPLDDLFHSNRNTPPSCESLCKVLHTMLKQAEEVWVVLDAIDECTERKGGPTNGLLSWLLDLMTTNDNVRCLVTSRPEQDIQAELTNLTSERNRIPIQSDLVREDILEYIYSKVRTGKGLKRWRGHPDVQKEIEERLAQKAQGMFRWVACQIDALEHCLNYPTLKSALDSLPKTLDDTYARILMAVPASHKPIAMRILQLLTFSERPLRIEEVVDAIAVDTDRTPHFSIKDRMPEPSEITSYCSGLVVVVSTRKLIRGKDVEVEELQLAHFSVQEYLTSDRLDASFIQMFEGIAARASIAKVCLAYLLHFDLIPPLQEVRELFPFAEYCATYWMSHVDVAGYERKDVFSLVERLFCYQTSSYQLCYKLHQPDIPYYARKDDEPAPPLYYAAFGGLKEVVQLLLDQNVNINAQAGWWGSSLSAASAAGREAVVTLLLEKNADVSLLGNDRYSPIQAAAEEGHEAIVKLLLDNGADVNAPGNGRNGNALAIASSRGHEAIVKLLLERGANVNAPDDWRHGNALASASMCGHEAVVKLLLDEGADANPTSSSSRLIPLVWASMSGYEAVVKLLVDGGADVNALSNNSDCGALVYASSKGRVGIVKLLLDGGADGNQIDDRHCRSALTEASINGHDAVVKLLLNKGVDVNAQSSTHPPGTALIWASRYGHESTVKLLLDNGADINALGNRGDSNALAVALIRGHEAIVKLLLDKGAIAEEQEF